MYGSKSKLKVTLLGTGTSHGVPMIGCDCAVCRSSDVEDRRTRASIAVESATTVLLVDTSPELRLQCVENGITHIDGVLYTHAHADHIVGLDDLRRFNWLCGGAVHCYAAKEAMEIIRNMFAYAFEERPDYPSSKPELVLNEIGADSLVIGDIAITPIPLLHGDLPVLGFRFGGMAYCTDCSYIPERSMSLLSGLDLLILDGLRRRPHPTHFNLDQAVAVARKLGARRTLFTHIAHELGHFVTNAALPEGMALAHDGQVVVVEC